MSNSYDMSENDRRVLDAVLNGGGEASKMYVVDTDLKPDPHLDDETVEKLVQQEKQAIDLAETDSARAIEILAQIIDQYPEYASAYNNRAQAYRIADPSNGEAVDDCNKAIILAKPIDQVLSHMQARVLRNANAQLAAIHLERAKLSSNESEKWEHEQIASSYLAEAGGFGDRILAALATKVNPYAKLCGGMVEQALKLDID